MAFVVWILFTLGGWVSIPTEFLPLFSHCVGFGFFLTITTRKTRWLGALAIGALILCMLLYRTIPGEWIVFITQFAGYIAFAVFVIAAATIWKVTPDDLKEEAVQLGSVYFLQIKESLLAEDGAGRMAASVASFGLIAAEREAAAPEEAEVEEEGDEAEEDADAEPVAAADAQPALVDPEENVRRARELLRGVPEQDYCRIIAQLDAKLVELDAGRANLLRNFNIAVTKLSGEVEQERAKRIKAEAELEHARLTVDRVKTELAALRRQHKSAPSQVVKDALRKEKRTVLRLREELAVELSARQLAEREFDRMESECNRLQNIVDKKKGATRSNSAEIERLKKRVKTEERRRQTLQQQLQRQRESVAELNEQLELQRLEASEELETETGRLQSELDVALKKLRTLRHFAGEDLTSLSVKELGGLEGELEDVLRRLRERRAAAIEEENERLKEANQELEERMLCRICYSSQSSVVIIPCGHFCMCKTCAKRVDLCPVCRGEVEDTKDIFVA